MNPLTHHLDRKEIGYELVYYLSKEDFCRLCPITKFQSTLTTRLHRTIDGLADRAMASLQTDLAVLVLDSMKQRFFTNMVKSMRIRFKMLVALTLGMGCHTLLDRFPRMMQHPLVNMPSGGFDPAFCEQLWNIFVESFEGQLQERWEIDLNDAIDKANALETPSTEVVFSDVVVSLEQLMLGIVGLALGLLTITMPPQMRPAIPGLSPILLPEAHEAFERQPPHQGESYGAYLQRIESQIQQLANAGQVALEQRDAPA